jgi:ATP-dependent DNA helicase HFM1/MER3
VVERLFRDGKIKALCSTSTLAAGVNLPAHLVIIKSTLQYGPQGFQEYSAMDIFQMMGRAGRPQFDPFGVAVIITDDTRKQHYQDLCQGSVAVESQYYIKAETF